VIFFNDHTELKRPSKISFSVFKRHRCAVLDKFDFEESNADFRIGTFYDASWIVELTILTKF